MRKLSELQKAEQFGCTITMMVARYLEASADVPRLEGELSNIDGVLDSKRQRLRQLDRDINDIKTKTSRLHSCASKVVIDYLSAELERKRRLYDDQLQKVKNDQNQRKEVETELETKSQRAYLFKQAIVNLIGKRTFDYIVNEDVYLDDDGTETIVSTAETQGV